MKSFLSSLQLPCGALFRLYFCLYVILFAILGLNEDGLTTNRIIDSAGPEGYLLMYSMIAIAFVGLVDTIINDVLPAKYTFAWALDFRHQIFLLMAMCFAVMIWFALGIKSYIVIPSYSLHILGLVVSSVIDIRERYQCKNIDKHGVSHA